MKFAPMPAAAKHLINLEHNSAKFFGEKFSNCTSVHGTGWATFSCGKVIYFLKKFYWDTKLGVQYRVIVIEDFGKDDFATHGVAQYKFEDYKNIDATNKVDKNAIPTYEMLSTPRLFVYTNKFYGEEEKVKEIFKKYQPDTYIEIIEETKMHKSVFISYGSPDEEIVSIINSKLKSKGVKTWFFPEDHVPGSKLHRMMSQGIFEHEKTLLICSKSSLNRGGVLNEIERLFELEASEGGSERLIPLTLDDYIFTDWSPEREDIKRQILSRVVSKVDIKNIENQIDKISQALLR